MLKKKVAPLLENRSPGLKSKARGRRTKHSGWRAQSIFWQFCSGLRDTRRKEKTTAISDSRQNTFSTTTNNIRFQTHTHLYINNIILEKQYFCRRSIKHYLIKKHELKSYYIVFYKIILYKTKFKKIQPNQIIKLYIYFFEY